MTTVWYGYFFWKTKMQKQAIRSATRGPVWRCYCHFVPCVNRFPGSDVFLAICGTQIEKSDFSSTPRGVVEWVHQSFEMELHRKAKSMCRSNFCAQNGEVARGLQPNCQNGSQTSNRYEVHTVHTWGKAFNALGVLKKDGRMS